MIMSECQKLQFPSKEVQTSLEPSLGERVSPKVLAHMDVMKTAEMLHTYALYTIGLEVPTLIDEVREEVSKQVAELKEFDISTLKFRLFDALQVLMTTIAELYMKAEARTLGGAQPDSPAEE
jgi:hypothetical protein